MIVEVEVEDHDLVVPGLPVVAFDPDGLVEQLDGPLGLLEITVNHREIGDDVGVAR